MVNQDLFLFFIHINRIFSIMDNQHYKNIFYALSAKKHTTISINDKSSICMTLKVDIIKIKYF